MVVCVSQWCVCFVVCVCGVSVCVCVCDVYTPVSERCSAFVRVCARGCVCEYEYEGVSVLCACVSVCVSACVSGCVCVRVLVLVRRVLRARLCEAGSWPPDINPTYMAGTDIQNRG